MGALVEPIANRIKTTMNDAGGASWTEPVIHDAIFEAEKVVTNLRPDVTAIDAPYVCAQGSKQSIASMSPMPHRLLNAKYNVIGGSPARAIRRTIIGTHDTARPNWRSDSPSSTIKEFVFDPREPLIFEVWPPAIVGTVIQIAYSAVPTPYGEVDETTQTTVNELYEPMLIEWALYRLFGHDVEGSVNIGRSQQHMQTFNQMMGTKYEGEKTFGPKNRESER